MIHAATIKKAEKLGISLSEEAETGRVDAHWVEHNVHAYGDNAKTAMKEIEIVIGVKTDHPTHHIENSKVDLERLLVFNDDRTLVLDREGTTAADMLLLLNDPDHEWQPTAVPNDGGEAYKAGFTAGDNPFRDDDGEPLEDDDGEAELWDEEWDAEADAEDEDEGSGGSVVRPEYRARYAEAGHPNHCGDWLADILNALVLGKSSTDIETFEAICNANDVDMEKYNRISAGWQGRFRMTGRNLMARKIYLNNGVMLLPKGVHPDGLTEIKATDEWMASQKFKMPKAELAQAEKQKADAAE